MQPTKITWTDTQLRLELDNTVVLDDIINIEISTFFGVQPFSFTTEPLEQIDLSNFVFTTDSKQLAQYMFKKFTFFPSVNGGVAVIQIDYSMANPRLFFPITTNLMPINVNLLSETDNENNSK